MSRLLFFALLVVLALAVGCTKLPDNKPGPIGYSAPELTLAATAVVQVAAAPGTGPADATLAAPSLSIETAAPVPGLGPSDEAAAAAPYDAGEQGQPAIVDGLARAQPSSRGGNRLPWTDDGPVAAVDSQPISPAAEPAPPPGRPAELMVYVVVSGDTLLGLAERFGVSPDTILWANGLEGKADDLGVGQELTILPVSGVLHLTDIGDTVTEIAADHEAAVAKIVQANGLTDPDALTAGQRLVVPGGKPQANPRIVAQERSAAKAPQMAAPDARPAATSTTAAPSAASQQPVVKIAPTAPASVSPVGGEGRGAAIVDVAMQFVGYSYTWGGHSASTGFDCTGFTWYVYGQLGIAIPLHNLWGQLGAGPRVANADLLPGDLIFFQNTDQPGLSHSALYIGNRMMVHAASERTGVRIDSIDDAYWGPRWFGASRPW
ncbi:MAG: C40 family peptidase [Chloroflexota bacterium]